MQSLNSQPLKKLLAQSKFAKRIRCFQKFDTLIVGGTRNVVVIESNVEEIFIINESQNFESAFYIEENELNITDSQKALPNGEIKKNLLITEDVEVDQILDSLKHHSNERYLNGYSEIDLKSMIVSRSQNKKFNRNKDELSDVTIILTKQVHRFIGQDNSFLFFYSESQKVCLIKLINNAVYVLDGAVSELLGIKATDFSRFTYMSVYNSRGKINNCFVSASKEAMVRIKSKGNTKLIAQDKSYIEYNCMPINVDAISLDDSNIKFPLKHNFSG